MGVIVAPVVSGGSVVPVVSVVCAVLGGLAAVLGLPAVPARSGGAAMVAA